MPKLIIGADTMKTSLDILEPAMIGDQAREIAGAIVLGTVEGDLHEISKTRVGMMLTTNGFTVIDIGVDKTASEFIRCCTRVRCKYCWRFSIADHNYAPEKETG